MPPEVSSTSVRIGRRLLDERVADRGDDPPDRDPAVLHRHELMQVLGIECPGVDDLLAPRVDDFDTLAAANSRRLALSRRDLDHRRPRSGRSLPSIVAKLRGYCRARPSLSFGPRGRPADR